MPRFHAVAASQEFPDGTKQFTAEEESARDMEEAQAVIDKVAAVKAQSVAAVKSEMAAADLTVIRALTEGDTARIAAHNAAQAARRAKLK